MNSKEVKVKTHDGYKGNEKPLSIFLNQTEVKVQGIIYRSIVEDAQTRERKEVFVIRGDDTKIYHLAFLGVENKWILVKVET